MSRRGGGARGAGGGRPACRPRRGGAGNGRGEVATLRGGGAAGGLGAGLAFFARAELLPGASWVLDRVGFDAALAKADFVITGEGTFDRTSLLGKVTDE